MATSFLDKTGLGLVWAQIKLLLADKVDKVDGKGLSSNDYTADEKAKLANIAAGAEVNVNADWNAVTGDAAILNKPTNVSDFTNDAGYLTSYTETDPTVPEWAKAANKPKYTASEVGAMSSNVVIAVGGTVKITGTSASFNLNFTINQVYVAANDGKSVQVWDKTNNRLYELVDMDYDDSSVKFTFINMASNTIRIIKTGFLDALGTSKTFSGTYSTIDLSTFSGSYDDLMNKPTIPTNNNQLTNGSGYQTASDVNALIAAAVGDITGVDFEVVATLPATGETGVIYLIANGGSGDNSYDEYIWLSSSSSFEKIGTTDVDLSDYYNTTNLIPITSAEINTICV